MLFNIFMLIAGLSILIWSTDRFVYGTVTFARNLRLPPMLIGLTIVAMGTSSTLALPILLSKRARALKPWYGGVLLFTFISYQLVLFLA